MIFTTIPSSVYSTTVIQYNSYQEFRFRLYYMNDTSKSIWRGLSMGYTCCGTYFHTITVYSVASCDLNTHIHHGGQQFLWRGTISLREFKVTFSTVVCELELKYGVNYTEAVAFNQLARYVHYEALDVYEQHSARILVVT